MTTLPQAKLDALLDRHAMLEAELSRQLPPETFVKLSREFAEIDPVVQKAKAYRSVANEIAELDAMIADAKTDTDMRDMAYAEKPALEARQTALVVQDGVRQDAAPSRSEHACASGTCLGRAGLHPRRAPGRCVSPSGCPRGAAWCR